MPLNLSWQDLSQLSNINVSEQVLCETMCSSVVLGKLYRQEHLDDLLQDFSIVFLIALFGSLFQNSFHIDIGVLTENFGNYLRMNYLEFLRKLFNKVLSTDAA